MNKTTKTLTILLIILLVIPSLAALQSVNAYSIPTPSTPQYTVTYADDSYDVPPQTTVNSYTGKTEINQQGYRVQNRTVTLTIKNQPFTVYTDSAGNIISLFYIVQVRGHFDGSWYCPSGDTDDRTELKYIKAQGDYPSTVLVYGSPGNGLGYTNLGAPSGGEVDFRIQAFIGYVNRVSDGYTMFGEIYHYDFTGQTSDYSSIQTIKLPEDPTPTQIVLGTADGGIQIPTNTMLTIIAGLLAVIVALLLWIGFKAKRGTKHA
jgi:hypothetical protein